MILWGIISSCTVWIETPTQFYVARLLLGIAEAGFFPGAMVFFTFWYPATRRARVIGIFALAVPVAGVVGGIVSGWILHTFESTLGLKGWQWLFLFEGMPPVLAGVLVYLFLTEGPEQAKWLTTEEREVIVSALKAEAKAKGTHAANHQFKEAIKNPRIYVAAFVYTAVPWVASVVTYWGPQLIKDAGGGSLLNVGFISAIPYLVGASGMLLICRSSDKRLERRWHWAASAILAACSVALLPVVKGNLVATVIVLSFVTMGFLSIAALFFTIPLSYLSGTAAAGGIALISALGQTGGFAAPTVIGYLKQSTGSLAPGLYLVTCVLALGAATLLLFIPANSLKERNAHRVQ
jgi:ACS family phthalate transporter-like MFS transporter